VARATMDWGYSNGVGSVGCPLFCLDQGHHPLLNAKDFLRVSHHRPKELERKKSLDQPALEAKLPRFPRDGGKGKVSIQESGTTF